MKSDKLPNFVHDVVLAFCLLTRLPMPRLPVVAFDNSARAVWAYALVGAVLGAILAGIGTFLLWLGLPAYLCAGLTLTTGLLATGALHEDGLADTADGLWGGHTPDGRLNIMKDSRIGTYGTLALICVIGLRWAALAGLLVSAPLAIIAAASLSRACMSVPLISLPPARPDGLARSLGKVSLPPVFICCSIGLVCVAVCTCPSGWAPVLVACGTTAAFHGLARTKLGGYSGDLLGATQQVSELLILITFVGVLT